MPQEIIRDSVIAGSWYPGNPDTLREEIRRYLEKAGPVSMPGELRALIVPHAGYMYSGGVAAHAYRLLQGQSFDRVVIVAPSHRAYFKGASVYTLGGYRTPLGVVPLDREIIGALLEHSSVVRFVPEADAQEHSLEIQLPFLQVVLGDFRLTPIIMADHSYSFCEALAEALCSSCGEMRVLLIASTDLSHFHSYAEAKRLDQVVCDRVASFDPQALSLDLRAGKCEACGAGPMMAVMLAARRLGANGARVLKYANSGDVAGDKSRVVGYLAAALYCSTPTQQQVPLETKPNVGVDLGLNEEDKRTLREVARQAIRSRCRGEPMPEISSGSAKLKEKCGAFVSLHKGEELRGCIGMIEAKAPLLETVKQMAVQAAFSDPRFCTVREEELADLDIEISVLTPLRPVKSTDEIEIGKHGLYIRKGYRSGLLLPQVAAERGWDREQFLQWTCRKAGLPDHAWKDTDAELFLFSADVF
jgi:AmmeMemoRadiSam system protein B/AmmeMemoRadiSam system protein A